MSRGCNSCFLFIFSLLFSLFVTSYLYQTSYGAQTSVSPDLYRALEDESFVAVLVFLDDPAYMENTSLSSLEDKEKNDPSIFVKTLQEKAEYATEIISTHLETEIENGNIVDYQPFWIVNAFSASINKEALELLSDLPYISSIKPDRQHFRPEVSGAPFLENEKQLAAADGHLSYSERKPWNLALINVPRAWQEEFFGDDIVVAIMDTGVDPDHPQLRDSYRGNLPGHSHETSWYDAAGNLGNENKGPHDLHGHGTHMAGIIMGGNPENPLGIAPAAKWIAVNIFSNGYTWDSHVIKAYQWLLAPGGNPGHAPDIINCSWASRPEYGSDYLQWEILHKLEKAGVFVVFAAGNNAQEGPGSPASYPHAFSVGALNENFRIANFSSRGPVDWQEMTFLKPELVAPGTNIESTWVGGGSAVLDGTSTAAAHVAGAAALILESRPESTPSEIKNILQETASWHTPWNEEGSKPNNTYGYGLLNVYAALKNGDAPEKEILFFDDADEGLLNWETSPQNSWEKTAEKVHTGDFSFADSPNRRYANNTNSWLSLLNPIHLCQHWTPVLSFHHFYDFEEGRRGRDDYGYIEVSQNGEDWMPIFRFSGSNEYFQHFSLPLHLPQETNDIYIRFRLQSNNNGPGKGWYLDNIQVSAVPRSLEGLKKLHLAPETTVLGAGGSSALEAEALFCHTHTLPLDPKLITWSSSNRSVAIVDDGNIKGRAAGEAVLKGEFAGQSSSIEVKVVEIDKPDAKPQPGVFIRPVEVHLTTEIAEADIYYTLDGSKPDLESSLYEEPFSLEQSTTVKARVFLDEMAGPEAELSYKIEEGSTVKGLINLQGRQKVDEITEVFFICQEKETPYRNISLQKNGLFSADLPLGSYLLVIKRQQYLTKIKEVEIQGKETKIQLGSFELDAGDISGNNKIGLEDLILLSQSYNTTEGDANWNPQADLNGDGVINNHDLALLRDNFGKEGASYRK